MNYPSARSPLSRLTLRPHGSSALSASKRWLRARLKLEELENREVLSLTVAGSNIPAAPGYLSVAENVGGAGTSLAFNGDAGPYVSVSPDESGCDTAPFSLEIVAVNGTLSVDASSLGCYGISPPTGNGTGDLTLTAGDTGNLSSFLNASGFTYSPNLDFSGTEQLALTATDNVTPAGTLTIPVFVSPVAAPPSIAVTTALETGVFGPSNEYPAPNPNTTSGFAIPVTFSVDNTFGNETVQYMDVTFPPNQAPDPSGTGGFATSSPGSSTAPEGGLRFDANFLGCSSFGGQTPLQPSTFDLSAYAVAFTSAVDPNGNTVLSPPAFSGAGNFTVEFLPSVDFYEQKDFDGDGDVSIPENFGGSSSTPIDPILLDPTNSVAGNYTLVLNAPDGVLAANDPALGNFPISVAGNGSAALTIIGDLSQIQQYLDSFNVSFAPAPGFSGNANVTADLTAPDGRIGSGFDDVTVVPAPTVSLALVVGTEGQPIDLGGVGLGANDAKDFGCDTFTLSVLTGTLSLAPDNYTDNGDGTGYLNIGESSIYVTGDGTGTITLNGPLPLIDGTLAQSGELTYTPTDIHFAGIVPMAVSLTTFSVPSGAPLPQGYAFLVVAPFPPTAVDVTTSQDTPVPLSIALDPRDAVPDPNRTLAVVVALPPGSSLNHGTDLGDGTWILTPDDLTGLYFTPPPGSNGVAYPLAAQVVSTTVGDLPPFPPPLAADTLAPLTSVSSLAVIGFAPLAPAGPSSATPADTVVAPPPTASSAPTPFTVTVTPTPVTPASPPPTSPPPTSPPPVSPPPVFGQTPTPTVVVAPPTDTSATGTVGTATTATTTTTATTVIPDTVPGTVAAFGFIPGVEVQFSRAADPTTNPFSLQPLGALSATAAAASAFVAGRDKHPLPPILPLDQTLPAAGFEGSGDSIKLIDQLYRDAEAAPAAIDPKGSSWLPPAAGEPSLSQGGIPAAMAVAKAQGRASPGFGNNLVPAASAAEVGDEGEGEGIRLAAVIGVLPFIGASAVAGRRRRPKTVRHWLQHLMFKPRTART